MKKIFKKVLSLTLFIFSIMAVGYTQQESGKLRIIMFGAHPDDCEKAGGTAALFAQMGYAVKFVSVTNGDAGHQVMKGEPLAKRRYAEAQEAALRHAPAVTQQRVDLLLI